MLADPQSITVGGTAKSLPRVLTGTQEGRFVGPDNRLEVLTSTARNGRVRTTARFVNQKVTSDPLVSTTNVLVSDQITLTINRPAAGYTEAELLDHVKAVIAWLTASSDAVLKKIIAGEN